MWEYMHNNICPIIKPSTQVSPFATFNITMTTFMKPHLPWVIIICQFVQGVCGNDVGKQILFTMSYYCTWDSCCFALQGMID